MDVVEWNEEQPGGADRRAWWPGRCLVALAIVALLAVPVLSGDDGGAHAALHPSGSFAECTGATYTVVSGDGWWLIASKNKVTMDALLAANKATTSTALFPGQVLCLPAGATAPSTTATTTTAPKPGSVSIKQFPVQGPCWFTDTFGAPRSGGRSHEGVDIIAKSGLYLYAADDGTLTKQYIAGTNTLTGNGWNLTRADGTYFFYAHLSAFATGLKVGSKVKAGQIIGFVGMTGNAGSPHLHFEVHPGGGGPTNPTPIVKAVDGSATSTVPVQPGTVTTTVPVTAAPTTVATTTTVKPTTTTTARPTTTTSTTTTAPRTTNPPQTAPPATPTAGRWQFIAPVMALDTNGATLTPNLARTVRVDGLAGVAVGTPGVMLRVNARNVPAAGFLTVHSCTAGPNGTSTMSVVPNRLNALTTMVATSGGNICVTSSVALDLRLAVVGYQAVDGTGVQPIAAKRALDTRATGRLAAGVTAVVKPAALGAPLGSKAVTVSVTLLNPSGAGSLGIGPCGGTPWIVAYSALPAQMLSAITRINDAGLCITSTASVNVIVDVTGVWTGASPVGVVPTARVFDSRPTGGVGTGGKTTPTGLASTATRGQYTISLVAGATAGFVQIWNCAEAKPAASVAYAPPNSAVTVTVTLNTAGGSLCMATNTTMQVIVDLVAGG